MTTMYSAVTFPQATGGYSWGPGPAGTANYLNSLSGTQTMQGALYPTTWSPQSANAADRTAYVVDTAGTLSLEQAQTACFGVPYFQANQIALVTQDYNAATDYVPVTIGGTTYQVDNTSGKQALNLSLAITANPMIAASAWAASTVYAAGAYCSVGGVILFCSTAGKSGTSAPTAPTAFGTPVTDGTAAWELLGRKVFLQGGSFVYMTPQQIMSAFQQGELYLHTMSDQLVNLTAQINAATTVSAVQAIVW